MGNCKRFCRYVGIFSGLWTDSALYRDQFWNTDQVVGGEVDDKVFGNPGNAAMFGFAHRCLLVASAIRNHMAAPKSKGFLANC